MYIGKKKCRVLRGIRKKIADANGISYAPHKCGHKGDCKGTCPACEQEMRYIEGELNKRTRLGKAAAVVGTAIGIGVLTSGLSSCRHILRPDVVGDVPATDTLLRGEVGMPDTDTLAIDSTEIKEIQTDGSTDSDITP
ncbi:MAG: hypothetical protein J6129_02260 [Bacteroidaceae bacterium]|nr:hypothetical protein [Bacteroidaceae bacterium]